MERIEEEFIWNMNDYIQQHYQDYDNGFDADRYNDDDSREEYVEELRQDFFNSDEGFYGGFLESSIEDSEYLQILVEVCKYYRDEYGMTVPIEDYLDKEKILGKYAYQLCFDDRIVWEDNNDYDSDSDDEPPILVITTDDIESVMDSILNASPAA